MNSKKQEVDGGRLFALDALRGVAAAAVLLFHLFRLSPQTAVLASIFPGPVRWIFDYGRNGVALFFVLSGFVIAYSLRHQTVDGKQVREFAIRRQLRLDPPYWVVLAAVLAIDRIERFVGGLEYVSHRASDVALNVIYAQRILNRPSVLAVAWTLCLEVQFYLIFVALAYAAFKMPRLNALSLLFVTGIASMAANLWWQGSARWAAGSWHMFCAGVLVCWAMTGRCSRSWLYIYILLLFCHATVLEVRHADPFHGQWFVVGAVLLLTALSVRGLLQRSGGHVLQWLGSISYSLYLVHLPVIQVVMAAGNKLDDASKTVALGSWLAGGITSLVCARLLHRFVEQPSQRMARRVGRRSTSESPENVFTSEKGVAPV